MYHCWRRQPVISHINSYLTSYIIAMYEITKDIKAKQAREKFVLLSELIKHQGLHAQITT
jgi:hypothetical protein